MSGDGSDLNPPCLSATDPGQTHPGSVRFSRLRCFIAFSLLGEESGIRLPDVLSIRVVLFDGKRETAINGVIF